MLHDSDYWHGRLTRLLEDQVPEDSQLDYKEQRALNSLRRGDGGVDRQKRALDVSKDVSSFLNSNGGVLIYGVPETDDPNMPGGTPVSLGESDRIGFEPKAVTREAVEDLVTSNIQPKPGNHLFQVIEVPFCSRKVIIVEVEPGIGDVWQAKDHRYYRRFNFKSEPMEHYEIELV